AADQLAPRLGNATLRAQLPEVLLQILELGVFGVCEHTMLQEGRIAPGFERPAFELAMRVAVADALGFPEDDDPLEELGNVAGGVARQVPADRLVAAAEQLQVRFRFPGTVAMHRAKEG